MGLKMSVTRQITRQFLITLIIYKGTHLHHVTRLVILIIQLHRIEQIRLLILERLFILIVNLTKIFRIPPMGIITRRIICDSKGVIRVLVTNDLLLKLSLVMMMTNEKQRDKK